MQIFADSPPKIATSLRCMLRALRLARRGCQPTAHCNKLRDSVVLWQKLRLGRKLRPASQRLAN